MSPRYKGDFTPIEEKLTQLKKGELRRLFYFAKDEVEEWKKLIKSIGKELKKRK